MLASEFDNANRRISGVAQRPMRAWRRRGSRENLLVLATALAWTIFVPSSTDHLLSGLIAVPLAFGLHGLFESLAGENWGVYRRPRQ